MTRTKISFRAAAFSLLLPTLLAGSAKFAAAADLPSDFEERIKVGVHAYENGEKDRAFEIFYKLMSEGSRKFGDSDGRMVRLYTNLGELYSEQEQFDYAEQCLKRGLNVATKGFGAKSIQAVPPMIDLAQMYVKTGQYDKAQPLFKQALAIVDQPGQEAWIPYVIVIETDLGAMFFTAGNYNFAEPHFKKAAQLAATNLGANHKWTTTIGGMYAASLSALGKAKDAKQVEQAAIAKANETQSPIYIWNKQIGIAEKAIAEKQFTEAETALKQSLQAAKELPSEPMFEAASLSKYGTLMLAQDKPKIAIQKLKAAQALAEPILGLDDITVLERAGKLAALQKQNEQYPEAEPLYLRVLAHAKKTSGPESPEYIAIVTDLADMYSKWAQYPKAANYYGKLLAFEEKRSGADSEKLIPLLVALASVSQNDTKHFSEVNESAETYLKRAADITNKKYGKTSKETAEVLDQLSHYYHRRFEWEKAAKTCAQVIASTEKNYGPNSEQTVKALEYYAVVLRGAGLRNQAEPIEARVAKIKNTKTNSEE